jgi:6-phosphogluconolactonase
MTGILAMTVYLGCYTDAANQNGLKALSLDEGTGRMEVVAQYPVSKAIYQALSPDGRTLYSCTGEGLASFEVGERGELAAVDKIDVGNCVCHVAAMPDGGRVVFADYLGGFAGSVEVSGGRFGKPVIHQHAGSGPNLPRQDKAHCHQALPLPDGSGYCVADLGLDQIVEYPAGRIFATTPSGAGPRHVLFHPNGRLAFLVSELGNLVTSLSWSPTEGFRTLDVLPTIISRRDAETQSGSQNLCASAPPRENYSIAAAIRFTPDMKRVVVSNRGENSLVVYDFDEATGKMALKARTLLTGSWPRDFMFVAPTLALATMERSGEVHALRYDPESGEFAVVSTLGGLFRPVALLPLPQRPT